MSKFNINIFVKLSIVILNSAFIDVFGVSYMVHVYRRHTWYMYVIFHTSIVSLKYIFWQIMRNDKAKLAKVVVLLFFLQFFE